MSKLYDLDFISDSINENDLNEVFKTASLSHHNSGLIVRLKSLNDFKLVESIKSNYSALNIYYVDNGVLKSE